MFELLLALLTLGQGPAALDRLPPRDSLFRELVRAEDDLARVQRVRREGVAGSDTVEAGPVRLIVRRADHEVAESVAPDLAAVWTKLFGAGQPRVTLVAVRRASSVWTPGEGFALQAFGADDPFPIGSGWIRPDRLGRLDADRLAQAAWTALAAVLAGRADTDLMVWLKAPASPDLRSYQTDDLHYQVATTRSRAARRCFDGALTDCPEAFGLGPGAGTATLQLRHSLFAYALTIGPPGAWPRLLAEPAAPMARRLAAAAGQPIDSVFVGWQRWRVAHRPRALAIELGRWAAAGAWLLVGLAAVAGYGGRR